MYVNYSKTDKFGEMKFVLPPWMQEYNEFGSYKYWENKDSSRLGIMPNYDDSYELLVNGYATYFDEEEFCFIASLLDIEKRYNKLIELGWQAQQAAEILPQCTAADVIMSGFSSDFEFIFRLRTSYIHETGMPHPLVSEVMDTLYDEFVKRNYIKCLTKNS